MKILHYALGFPPYRSGGLTRYVMDLAEEQRKHGNDVNMMWPGEVLLSHRVPSIKQHRPYRGIGSYELRNSLPVVLDQPVGEPQAFIQSVNGTVYYDFLATIAPDVIHIHTLQGLHKEFVEAATELQIPTFFTTHDFFGLYPMNEIYPMDHELNDYESTLINQNAPKLHDLVIMQSRWVRYLKSSVIARKCLAHLSTNDGHKKIAHSNPVTVKPYHVFREYEKNILEQIDCILYNSTISKIAYERYISPKRSMVQYLTHSALPTQRQQVELHSCFNVAFVGGIRPYKGLDFMLKVFSGKSSELGGFRLNVFGVQGEDTETVRYLPKYSQFESAMKNMDVVIVPSMTYESFGFVVLEAIALGLPVLVSDVVGAKDLLAGHDECIFRTGDADDCWRKITDLKEKTCNRIEIDRRQYDMEVHCSKILEIYKDM
ncbi:glycosyltransferase [Bifidobacterium boum]|uniref:glycosyltransferase n=1 Tax=Bifidobacterium boum TaxID=78343 RepID=UPI003F936362